MNITEVIKTKRSDMAETSRMQGEQYVHSFSQKTWRDEITC